MTPIIARAAVVIVIATANFAAASQTTEVDARDERGATALHFAAAYGDVAEVRSLIAGGADVNRRGAMGNTPLLLAVQEGHSEIVAALLETGADADITSDYNNTAIGLAKGHGHREIVAQLQASQRLAQVAQQLASGQQIFAMAAGIAALVAVPVLGLGAIEISADKLTASPVIG